MYELELAEKVEKELPMKLSKIEKILLQLITVDAIKYNKETGQYHFLEHSLHALKLFSDKIGYKIDGDKTVMFVIVALKIGQHLRKLELSA